MIHGSATVPAHAECNTRKRHSLLVRAVVVVGLVEIFLGTVPAAKILLNFATVVRGLSKMAKPRCFFDITIGNAPAGRVIMEVSGMKIAFECCGNMAVVLPVTGTRVIGMYSVMLFVALLDIDKVSSVK